MTRPGTDGWYSVKGLRLAYFLAAPADLETGEWNDPCCSNSSSGRPPRITLRDGETRTQDFRIWRGVGPIGPRCEHVRLSAAGITPHA